MRFPFAISALVVLPALSPAFGQSAQTLGNPEWVKPFPPFRIVANVYWVGTYDLSTYLITTPEGHILINTGLASTVPQIKSGVEQLGFKFSDVKVLTATHGHFDHVAGLAELKRMTGAQVVMSERDAELLESGAKSDFRFGDDPAARFEPVKVDRRLKRRREDRIGRRRADRAPSPRAHQGSHQLYPRCPRE
jgi:metallo-beta-lactamase class B